MQAAALAAACAFSLTVVAGAAMSATPLGSARSLAVSVPPIPISISAGHSARTLIRVINPDPSPILVTLSGRAVTLGDNGQVRIGTGPDPVWSRLGNFPTRTFRVPGAGYVNLHITIHTPKRLAPDLYFLGFLVTPHVTKPGDLQVINQIGSSLPSTFPVHASPSSRAASKARASCSGRMPPEQSSSRTWDMPPSSTGARLIPPLHPGARR